MRDLIIEVIIFMEGFLLLTHGPYRQAFQQIYSEVMDDQSSDLSEPTRYLLSLSIMLILVTDQVWLKLWAVLCLTIFVSFQCVLEFKCAGFLSADNFFINVFMVWLYVETLVEKEVKAAKYYRMIRKKKSKSDGEGWSPIKLIAKRMSQKEVKELKEVETQLVSRTSTSAASEGGEVSEMKEITLFFKKYQ